MPNNEPKVLQHYNYSPLPAIEQFYNNCHAPDTGEFCSDIQTLRKAIQSQKTGTIDISEHSDFDIPRHQMPQLHAKPRPGSKADNLPNKDSDGEVDVTKQFLDTLKKDGIRVIHAKVAAKDLKPTQGEIDAKKVHRAASRPDSKDPVIISKDNFIIDGHHRWAANILEDPDHKINAVKVDETVEELLPYTRAFADHWGIENKAINASAVQFANPCHDPENGRFCEIHEEGRRWSNPDNHGSYNISMNPEDVGRSEEHYGRKEMAPEMGGPQWAFEGQSPPITSAAEDVLNGNDYDPYDRYLDYDKHQYAAADTILSTLEKESSDVTLYSGHRRDRETIDAILKEGVAFPLVATSPSKDLADSYAEAWRDPSDLSAAIVYEFPPGSQAGFYRFNEHIATGEYEVESYKWSEDNSVIDIKLRQTKRNEVPEKKPLYEEGEDD